MFACFQKKKASSTSLATCLTRKYGDNRKTFILDLGFEELIAVILRLSCPDDLRFTNLNWQSLHFYNLQNILLWSCKSLLIDSLIVERYSVDQTIQMKQEGLCTKTGPLNRICFYWPGGLNTYSTRAIITRSWFETTFDYKPQILGPKIEEFLF